MCTAPRTRAAPGASSGTNLPAVLVSDLEYGPDGTIYAATGGRSAWAIACTAPPSAVAGAGTADNEITLTWTGAATRYDIERSLGGCGGPFVPVGSVTAPPFSFVDSGVSGGVTYGYRVNTVDGCGTATGTCVEATTSGACTLDPAFAGAALAVGGGGSCSIRVDWPAASELCGGPLVYNVYRSTDPAFTPDGTNRIASCLTGLSHLDTAVTSLVSYTYVVRGESSSAPGAGPCGGREEANRVRVTGSPEVLHQTDFEVGLAGWSASLGTPPASSGDYVHGDPDGTFSGGNPAQPEDDHTPGGVNCLFTSPNPGGLGSDDVDGGEVMATSPAFDATGLASLRLTLWRWHFIRDLGEDDYFVLEVSNDGGLGWTTIDQLDANQSAAPGPRSPPTSRPCWRSPLTCGSGCARPMATAAATSSRARSTTSSSPAVRPAPPAASGRCWRSATVCWRAARPTTSSWCGPIRRRPSRGARTARPIVRPPGASIGSSLTPAWVDVGAVPAPPALYRYDVVAVCGGIEGPF